MTRDYGVEIDQLKKELDSLKERLGQKNDGMKTVKTICSFCGKNQDEVRLMVAGPRVNICNECTALCEALLDNRIDDISMKKYEKEIDCSFCGKNNHQAQKVIAGKDIHANAIANICNDCVGITLGVLDNISSGTKSSSNLITYSGSYDSGGRGSNWSSTANADDLFKLIENKTATQVLQGIGNNDRLSLLLAILQKPMNVATMVTTCGFNTTGQVYHHLKPLIAADLVMEEERGEKGVYVVVPHRVQGIIMILAGIADLVDTKFTEGDWSHIVLHSFQQ